MALVLTGEAAKKQIYSIRSNPRLRLFLSAKEKGREGFAERQKFNLVQYFLERGLFLKERRLKDETDGDAATWCRMVLWPRGK